MLALAILDKVIMDRNRHTIPLKTTEALPKRNGRKAVVKELTTPRKPKAATTAVVEWDLQLFVAGASPKSAAAFGNLKRLCDKHLGGRYRMKIVDLTKDPQLAQAEQIVALPALVRKGIVSNRKIIGNLSDSKRVLASLGIES
jgi:circadian clock protein KaiB